MFGWYLICRNMSTDSVYFRKSIRPFKKHRSFVWIYSQLQIHTMLYVVITSDYKQSTQCSKAAAKGMNSLRVIRRTFKYIDAESFLILRKAYIRPPLEYSVQSWNPALQKDINALEKVQRRATKLVPQLKNQTYEEGLCTGPWPKKTSERRFDWTWSIQTVKRIWFEDMDVHVDSQKFFKLKA